MLLFGHIGVTLGVFFGLAFLIPQLRTIIDPTYLVIGSLLPDLIDKPLGTIVFPSAIANGRMITHTLFFSFTLFLTGLYLYDKSGDIKVLTLASGSIFTLLKIGCGHHLELYFGLSQDGVSAKIHVIRD